MGKLKARSVELTKELAELTYRDLLGRTGLGGEDRKEWKRITAAFEASSVFKAEVEDGPCPACGNLRSHFEADGRGILVPVTKQGRKLLYDQIVESTIRRHPPLGLERRLAVLAKALGFAAVFEGLIEAEEPEDGEEYEEEAEDAAAEDAASKGDAG